VETSTVAETSSTVETSTVETSTVAETKAVETSSKSGSSSDKAKPAPKTKAKAKAKPKTKSKAKVTFKIVVKPDETSSTVAETDKAETSSTVAVTDKAVTSSTVAETSSTVAETSSTVAETDKAETSTVTDEADDVDEPPTKTLKVDFDKSLLTPEIMNLDIKILRKKRDLAKKLLMRIDGYEGRPPKKNVKPGEREEAAKNYSLYSEACNLLTEQKKVQFDGEVKIFSTNTDEANVHFKRAREELALGMAANKRATLAAKQAAKTAKEFLGCV
jgi:hypothetical protein